MSRYTVCVLPDEFRRIKRLPGNVRQRVKNVIDELAKDPRPTQSKKLDVTGPKTRLATSDDFVWTTGESCT
ncbi:MAG: type II toxin-antitoxin system RelE family toxin [Pirellulaceae bacterium]